MKHLLLTAVLTVFSFNSQAAGRCMISFQGAGKDSVDQRILSKKNYQLTDLSDIREGELLASLSEIHTDESLSDENFQVVSFKQTIEIAYKNGRDLRLRVIHTKKILSKIPTAEFITYETSDFAALIGKLRIDNLPKCSIN